MFSFHKIATSTALLLSIALPAGAETVISMETLRAETEIRIIDGQPVETEILSPVNKSVPGDKITYRISLDNQDPVPATDISLVLPIHENVTYVEASTTGTIPVTSRFSVDDGTRFDALANLEVIRDGEAHPAGIEDITHIEILVPELDAHTEATVDYSITID